MVVVVVVVVGAVMMCVLVLCYVGDMYCDGFFAALGGGFGRGFGDRLRPL